MYNLYSAIKNAIGNKAGKGKGRESNPPPYLLNVLYPIISFAEPRCFFVGEGDIDLGKKIKTLSENATTLHEKIYMANPKNENERQALEVFYYCLKELDQPKFENAGLTFARHMADRSMGQEDIALAEELLKKIYKAADDAQYPLK